MAEICAVPSAIFTVSRQKKQDTRLFVITLAVYTDFKILSLLDFRGIYSGCYGLLPSVLWHCWLGSRKAIRSVKKWGDDGGGHWLVRMEWRPAGWSMFLPLLIFHCTIKSRSSLLAPAHPGGPGRRAVKWLWWLDSRGVYVFVVEISTSPELHCYATFWNLKIS